MLKTSVTLLLSHFDILCDLLQDRPTASWNLYTVLVHSHVESNKFVSGLKIKAPANSKLSTHTGLFANKSSFMMQEDVKDKVHRKYLTHTLGILVIPPTSSISPISLFSMPASLRHFLQGSTVLWIRSLTRDSNFARVSFMAKCLGPLASTVMYGKLMSVCKNHTRTQDG